MDKPKRTRLIQTGAQPGAPTRNPADSNLVVHKPILAVPVLFTSCPYPVDALLTVGSGWVPGANPRLTNDEYYERYYCRYSTAR